MRLGALALATAMIATTLASGSECEMTTSAPELAVGGFYVEADCWQPGCPDFALVSVWVYQETNGILGLQRDDEIVDDTCGGTAGPGDTIVF